MKFAAIILMTMNLWGSFLCCCQNVVCASGEQVSCGTMPELDAQAKQSQPACHGTPQKMVEPAPKSCHEEQASSRDAQQVQTKAGLALNTTCLCSSHGTVEISFTVPNTETTEIVIWQISDITAWFANLKVAVNSQAFPDRSLLARPWFNRAPGLSALSRFII